MILASSSSSSPRVTLARVRNASLAGRGRRRRRAIATPVMSASRDPPFAVPEEEDAPLEFYTHSLCPYAHRVSLCLAEKAVPHHRVHIDLSNKPAWYVKLNTRGLVPAIGLPGGDRVLTESIDLCYWLEENFKSTDGHPSLVPKDDANKEAEMRRLIDGFDGGFISAGLQYVGGGWGFSRGTPGARQTSRMASEVVLLENIIADNGGGPYLMGDEITLADVVLYPFAERFELAIREFRGGRKLGEITTTTTTSSSSSSSSEEDFEDGEVDDDEDDSGGDSSNARGLFGEWLRVMAERDSCKRLRPDDDALLASWRRTMRLDYFDYETADVDNP